MADMSEITSRKIVEVFGSVRAASEALKIRRSTLSDWKQDDKLPHPWPDYLRLKIQAGELPELKEALKK
jgi:hypothetical protein